MKRLILLFLFPVLVHAAPGPATQYLMNEPASLFDVGMLRLQHLIGYWEKQMTFNYRLKSQSDPVGGNVNAYYQSENDKIYVVLSTFDESATEQQMEAGCRYALQHIRIYVSKNLHGMFRHIGNNDSLEPAELMSAVTDMFELRCYVSGRSSADGRFWATQTLGANDMTIGKWELMN